MRLLLSLRASALARRAGTSGHSAAGTSSITLSIEDETDVAPRATWPGGTVAATRAALAAAFPQDDEWGPAAVIAES